LLCLLQYTSAEIYAIRFDSQFYFEEFEDAPATFGRKLSDGGKCKSKLFQTTRSQDFLIRVYNMFC
jgi:hypothetical protein